MRQIGHPFDPVLKKTTRKKKIPSLKLTIRSPWKFLGRGRAPLFVARIWICTTPGDYKIQTPICGCASAAPHSALSRKTYHSACSLDFPSLPKKQKKIARVSLRPNENRISPVGRFCRQCTFSTCQVVSLSAESRMWCSLGEFATGASTENPKSKMTTLIYDLIILYKKNMLQNLNARPTAEIQNDLGFQVSSGLKANHSVQ